MVPLWTCIRVVREASSTVTTPSTRHDPFLGALCEPRLRLSTRQSVYLSRGLLVRSGRIWKIRSIHPSKVRRLRKDGGLSKGVPRRFRLPSLPLWLMGGREAMVFRLILAFSTLGAGVPPVVRSRAGFTKPMQHDPRRRRGPRGVQYPTTYRTDLAFRPGVQEMVAHGRVSR